METKLRITVRDMEHSDVLDEHIRERVAKLERVYSKIMGCHVVAEMLDRHKLHGKQFTVRVDITVPGKEIVVSHHHAEDIYIAMRDAFDAAQRQLDEYAGIQRGEVKSRKK